jgi:hypothetical protein
VEIDDGLRIREVSILMQVIQAFRLHSRDVGKRSNFLRTVSLAGKRCIISLAMLSDDKIKKQTTRRRTCQPDACVNVGHGMDDPTSLQGA